MNLIRTILSYALTAVMLASFTSAATVGFEFAHVGNAGNAADPMTGLGSVPYNYSISKTEVTNAQYTAFLNAVASTDDFGGDDPTLYDNRMDFNSIGGITRNGQPGSYSYVTKANMADKPVTYVSFFDAMRFVNWLHNGQSVAGTETGVYTIDNGVSEVRSAEARFWIPSEDEWYKAAYHQPAGQGGDSDDYWLYPTASNTAPTLATANNVGDISNPGADVANYDFARPWDGILTTVGSAGPNSASFYGTFDQGGNVSEWNEAVLESNLRGFRGGSWNSNSIGLRSDNQVGGLPTFGLGFRVASVPEPSSICVGVAPILCLILQRPHLDGQYRGT